MTMKKGVAVLLTILASAPMAACGTANDDDGATTSDTAEELTTSKTVGDWRLFPNGQCLAAVQGFYPAKFGVSVPHSGPTTGRCESPGACTEWADDLPNNNDWERIPNDGAHTPTTYDLIVYPPPNGERGYGHVASVDHVVGKTIYVMDSNYLSADRKAFEPHTVSWPAYGWYRLRKLHNTPKPSVSCFPSGLYCGGDKVAGSSNDLYRCNDAGDGATLVNRCAHGCEVQSGRDDSCR